MKVGFTGTKEGMSFPQKEAFVHKLYSFGNDLLEFHHGDCVGADAEAHDIVREFFPWVKIIIHPPINDAFRAFKNGDEVKVAKEYLTRNHNIVNNVDYLIAAPQTNKEVWRSGTWATVRYARKKPKQHVILGR